MSERVASCGNLYDTNTLLLRYCNDDNVSAGSGMEMDDRLSHLEQRVQLQEDEIQLLKAALADALRRLGCCEETTQASSKKGGPTKVRQILQALPSKPLTNGYVQTKRLSGYPSSPSSPKKEVLMSIKRKSMSTERLSTVKKEMADSRSRTTSSSSSTCGKRDSKTKECTFNADDGYVRMFLRGRPITMHIPDQLRESYSLDHKVALPERKLKLQWVYGYRGRDCRSNLYLLPTGEIVYFNASVVVLYNVEEQQQRHYLGHNDDVKCLAIHPDMVTIATGQVAGTSKDGKALQPHVRVWDSVSLNTLHVIGAGVFDRAVTCVAFSKSNGGAHLCAVDDANDHILSVWDWQKEKQLAEVKVRKGGMLYKRVCGYGTLVSGGGKDRRVLLWDHDYRKKSEIEVPEAFGPVRTLAEGKQDELFVGTTRNAVLRGSFSGSLTPIVQGHTDELWGLDVHPSTEQFVTCGQDKQVYLWDTSSHLPLWSKAIEDPGRSVGFHPSGTVLAVGTMTGRWLVLDTDTRDLVSMHTDGNEIISAVKYSPDGAYLAVASHDNFVYIYSVTENGRKYSRVGKCTGHSSFVTHLDWSTDSQFIVTNSGDYEILFWEASSGKHITSADAVRNLEWATSTCVLGFNVFGIWPEGADGTDINALCRSHDNNLLASADDFGKVHLFSNPCSQPRAPSHIYGGHSSHVTNVAFLHDDSHLISTGGKDTSILQWVLA
ncbi:echinoderm microtubule-associated protein-like 2 [Sinocyclocheilus rhinocerous]|uniref:echinoderm microtubule-associated protein-like 2 n=1 Tax=Sinocyclocheilus rhinocerous TaxID=307959 RepID=UPI0007B80694|nr:PREDICTED: echinoderm microtubule-associated protein-like 2 [Sinocyclocheilus rhinocerous]